MGLAKSINDHITPGTRCRVSQVQELLAPDDLDALNSALADPRIPGAAIASALQSEGVKISAGIIQRHRRGECQCDD